MEFILRERAFLIVDQDRIINLEKETRRRTSVNLREGTVCDSIQVESQGSWDSLSHQMCFSLVVHELQELALQMRAAIR